MHSSRMCNSPLPIICVSVATRFQHQRGPQVNKFEQIYSLGHQMSLPGGLCTVRSMCGGQGKGGPAQWSPMSGWAGSGAEWDRP